MSSIMRARSGLMRRSERLEGIGGFLSRAEGCWTFDARDRVPQSSPSTAHRPAQLRTGGDARPSRESGFVRCPISAITAGPNSGEGERAILNHVVEPCDGQTLVTTTAFRGAVLQILFG